MSHYGKPEYWQDRYSRNSEPFDWYQRFYAMKEIIRSSAPPKSDSKILVPGCGNSRLAEEMLEEGYSTIINIDNSMTCVKNMAEKYKEKTERIKFQCMDVRSLSYENESFDAIVDKALLDCIMCSQNSAENVYKTLCEFHRVLKHKGTYFILSYQPPAKKLPVLEKIQFDWSVTVEKIPKISQGATSHSILEENQESTYHYLYKCLKN